MPLYTRPDSLNPVNVQDYPVGYGTELRNVLSEAYNHFTFFGSVHAGKIMQKLNSANLLKAPDALHSGWIDFINEQNPANDALMSREEAKALAETHGYDLPFDNGDRFPVSYVEAAIKEETARRHRASLIARGPQGFVPSTLNFLATLGASLTDPGELAANFIPIAGPAKELATSARMFKVARILERPAVRGVIDGAIGSSLTAPIEAGNMSALQQDYSAGDFMTNLIFGGALGGGLHMAGAEIGRFIENRRVTEVKDRYAKGQTANEIALETGLPPEKVSEYIGRTSESIKPSERIEAMPLESREAALRSAIGQADRGNPITVADEITNLSENARNPYNTELRQGGMQEVNGRDSAEFMQRAAAASEQRPFTRGVDERVLAEARQFAQDVPKEITTDDAIGIASDAERQVSAAVERITPEQAEVMRQHGTPLEEVITKDDAGNEVKTYKPDYAKFDEEIDAAKSLPKALQHLVNCLMG